jgi:menaquinone-dependent protoporphyrinogen IX oxidase
MIKRIFEITLGVIIAFTLFANYSDETHKEQLVIWYVLTPKVLKVVAWILLFLLAGRLIFGKYKDYSKYFYNLLIKLYGDPKNKKRNKSEP